MVVDLPAPFGPRKPNVSPAGDLEVDPAHGLDVAVTLAQPGNRHRECVTRTPRVADLSRGGHGLFIRVKRHPPEPPCLLVPFHASRPTMEPTRRQPVTTLGPRPHDADGTRLRRRRSAHGQLLAGGVFSGRALRTWVRRLILIAGEDAVEIPPRQDENLPRGLDLRLGVPR